jgi:hypothetical protein
MRTANGVYFLKTFSYSFIVKENTTIKEDFKEDSKNRLIFYKMRKKDTKDPKR